MAPWTSTAKLQTFDVRFFVVASVLVRFSRICYLMKFLPSLLSLSQRFALLAWSVASEESIAYVETPLLKITAARHLMSSENIACGFRMATRQQAYLSTAVLLASLSLSSAYLRSSFD